MIIHGNCIEQMALLPNESVDLVITSPPYAEQRKKHYNSITEAEYPQWTARWMEIVSRLLKKTGSVAIVVRTNLRKGVISDYVLKTRVLLHEEGWYEPEELIWTKPDAPPLGSVYRPRRSWENILWFARSGNVFCNPKADGAISTRCGFVSKKGVGDYKKGCKIPDHGISRVRDYIEAGTSHSDRSLENTHPAQFPVLLAKKIIYLLCPQGGCVLDPFLGSGTTLVACAEVGVNGIGIEINSAYCKIAENRLRHEPPRF